MFNMCMVPEPPKSLLPEDSDSLGAAVVMYTDFFGHDDLPITEFNTVEDAAKYIIDNTDDISDSIDEIVNKLKSLPYLKLSQCRSGMLYGRQWDVKA